MIRLAGGIDDKNSELLFAALNTLLKTNPDMIFVKDMNLTYVAATQSFAAMIGKSSPSEVIGKKDHDLLHEELAKRYVADDRKLLASKQNLVDYVEPLIDRNGEARYGHTSKYILTSSNGTPIGLLGLTKDITREIRTYQQYQKEIEFLFTLPANAYAAVFFDITNWRIIGERRQTIHDYTIPLFETIEAFLRLALPKSKSDAHDFYQQFTQEQLPQLYEQGHRDFSFEYERTLVDGSIYWIREEFKFLSNPLNGHLNLMFILRDIHQEKMNEKQLIQAATTDHMTGLLNRVTLVQQVDEILRKSENGIHAAFMIDVDNFKSINDTYGHQVGDEYLITLSNSIKACFQETGIAGRIGGDEFFVLAHDLPSLDAAKALAELLLQQVHHDQPEYATQVASISVGVSTYPLDGTTMDELYAAADAALYAAKNRGKNQAVFTWAEDEIVTFNASGIHYDSYNAQVTNHSKSPCYISDLENHDMLHMTKAAMDLYGMTSPEEYLGQKCYQVIMGLDTPCSYCPNHILKEHGTEEYCWEHYNERVKRWFDKRSTKIDLNGRPCHLMISHDITQRKEEVTFLSGLLSTEEVILRCIHTLTCEKDMDIAVNRFLTAVGGYYQADRAYIFEFDTSKNELNNTFEWCRKGVTAEIDTLQNLPLDIVDDWIRKFELTGEFSITSLDGDLDHNSVDYRILQRQKINSLMAAPLLQNGSIVGFVGVDNPAQHPGDLTLLRSVSEIVQVELDRRRMMNKLEHMSYTDMLTGLKNRNYYDQILNDYSIHPPRDLGVVFLNINGMDKINKNYGTSYGDHILQRTGQIMQEHLDGLIFRIDGDEFVALIEGISGEKFKQQMISLRSSFDAEYSYSVSIGSAWQKHRKNPQQLVLQASKMQSIEKQSYYNASYSGTYRHSRR